MEANSHSSAGADGASIETYFAELPDFMPPLPNTYLVLDVETDGLQPTLNNILQLGFLMCINGNVVSHSAVFVETPEDDLQRYENSDYVQRKTAEGNTGFVKAADVRAHGIPRSRVFGTLQQTVNALYDAGGIVIGHNLVGFDLKFIEYFSAKAGLPVKLARDRLFDTGAAFKAEKLRLMPGPAETLFTFFERVHAKRAAGVYWNLSLAMRETGLADKHTLDMAAAHDAGADVLMTHYLYQHLRGVIEARRAGPSAGAA